MGMDSDDQPGSDQAARPGAISRIPTVPRVILGVILVLAGIAMLVLPGQGVLTIIVGLNLIKPDNALVRYLRVKTPGIPNEGPIPKRLVWAGIGMFVAMTVLSLLFGRAILEWLQDLIRR